MTPTSCTLQKTEAAALKNVADPPIASVAVPKGVSMVSRATLPTTRRLIFIYRERSLLDLALHAIGSAQAEQRKSVVQDDLNRFCQHQPRRAQLRIRREYCQLRVTTRIARVIPRVHHC